MNIKSACPYCESWEKDPEALEKQGLPRGFCAFCSVCGKPGHISHAPGIGPYTDAWCDFCYKKVAFRANLQAVTFVGIFVPMFWRLWYISGSMLCFFIAVTWIIRNKPIKIESKI